MKQKFIKIRAKIGLFLYKINPLKRLFPLTFEIILCTKCKSPAMGIAYKFYKNGKRIKDIGLMDLTKIVTYRRYNCKNCGYIAYYKEIRLKNNPKVIK